MDKKRKKNSLKIAAFFCLFFGMLNFTIISGAETFKADKLAIQAHRLEIDQTTQIALFSGTVQAQQKDFTLKADFLKIFYNKIVKSNGGNPPKDEKSLIQKMEAYGKVIIIRGEEIIKGDKALFTPHTDSIIITGKDLLYSDGKNEAKACRLIFNRKDKKTILESCAKKKGVSLSIMP